MSKLQNADPINERHIKKAAIAADFFLYTDWNWRELCRYKSNLENSVVLLSKNVFEVCVSNILYWKHQYIIFASFLSGQMHVQLM